MKRVVAVVVLCLGASLALASAPAQHGQRTLAGDVTLDGQVDYMDLVAILDWESGYVSLSDVQLRVGDVTNDGYVNIDDAAVIAGRLASQGTVRVGVRMHVDPFGGVTSAELVNPFATIAERLGNTKAHEVNPAELSLVSGVCLDCTGCTATKQIQAILQWNLDATMHTGNLAQCQLDQLNGANNPVNCVIESQGGSYNTSLLVANGYAENVTRGPAGNGDGEIEDAEQMTVTSTVPLLACDDFGYFFDIRMEVIDPAEEE